ncbi:MAG: beta-eliminating lyase-related protein [Pseudomonadota bacterium]
MFFASDNSSPAHPQVLKAVMDASEGYTGGYGAEAGMERVREMIRDIFEAPEAAVYLVGTGTAANALALATLVEPWQTVFCHKVSHIEEDECGAPEFFTGGAKLVLIDGEGGRMDPKAFGAKAAVTGHIGVHNVQRGALSITNVSEVGTTYSIEDIQKLTGIAKAHNMPVHLDGARFANALVSMNCSPAEMTWKSGVDVVSFGGTKNGCMGVEAVVIFDPARAWEFELRRKRGGHLWSKHRYLSAQMDGYLADDLWLTLARTANDAAAELEHGLAKKGVSLAHPRAANMMFAGLTLEGHAAAQAAGAMYYPWDTAYTSVNSSDHQTVRLVTSWSTTQDDITQFLNLI